MTTANLAVASSAIIKQHLIDPEICIRCNTCEAICPVQAITHDSRNYVVDATKCNLCMDCISPCPTGSIDNWRMMPRVMAYTPEVQLTWDDLPAELSAEQLAEQAGVDNVEAAVAAVDAPSAVDTTFQTNAVSGTSANYGSTVPPWSAAHPYTNLHGHKSPVTATVVGNVRVTEVGKTSGADYDTHHIVLDFGAMPFPVLEGQSIGVLPTGVDAAWQTPPRPPILHRQPAQWRASWLQQLVANHQTRARRPPRQTCAWRGFKLHVRFKSGRHRSGHRPVWQQLFDAQPPQIQHRHDLHRHRQRPHARHDRVA